MTFIDYCVVAALLITVMIIIAAYYLGRYVYSLNDLDNIPFIDNSDNIAWINEQPDKESFSFLVIGDIQAGHRTISKQIFNRAGDNYVFTVQTGDLVSHADGGHYALTLYELNKSDLTVPLFVVPGNHDAKGNPHLFAKYFKLQKYFFQWSNCLFIFLDNSLGAPYDSQWQFLEQTLSAHRDKSKRTFIFMHRSPIDWEHGDPRPEMKNYSKFFDIQKRFSIDYVFSGHLHDYRILELDGTTYLSNGLECDQKGRALNEFYVTRVLVTPDNIVTEKIAINPSAAELLKGSMLDSLVAHVYPLLRRFTKSFDS